MLDEQRNKDLHDGRARDVRLHSRVLTSPAQESLSAEARIPCVEVKRINIGLNNGRRSLSVSRLAEHLNSMVGQWALYRASAHSQTSYYSDTNAQHFSSVFPRVGILAEVRS